MTVTIRPPDTDGDRPQPPDDDSVPQPPTSRAGKIAARLREIAKRFLLRPLLALAEWLYGVPAWFWKRQTVEQFRGKQLLRRERLAG